MNQQRDTRLPAPAPAHARARAAEYAGLVAWYIAVRVPFLESFDLVSHDGTYYITQARHLLATTAAAGAFPPGYPALVAAFMTVVGDGVRAAQSASAVSGAVSTLALFALARRFLPRTVSLLCAAVFAATPVFVRATLNTMSESAYIAWVLLSLLAFANDRRAWSGIALGAAALTRPEAIAVAAVLAVIGVRRDRSLRGAIAFGAGFLAVYSIDVAASIVGGHPSLLSKWRLFGASARDWRNFDAPIDAESTRLTAGAVLSAYAARLPGDLAELFRQVAGFALVLAVLGAVRRSAFILAAFVPLALVPLFTYRIEPRFVVPFVPITILCAFVGAATLARSRWRRSAYVALVAAAAFGVFANRAELTRHESAGFEAARDAGRAIRTQVAANARIADRKPFTAFYAGARYVEIPRGSYHDALTHVFENADYLALMRGVTDFFRPELAPLLYDEDAVLGELRFSQYYANDGGVMVYARSDQTDSEGGLHLVAVATLPPGPGPASYSQSADGPRVVVTGGIDMHSLLVHDGPLDASVDTLLTRGARVSQPAWSPNGARVAFTSSSTADSEIFVIDVESGAVSRVTTSAARDVDPAWDGDGAIVYASDRTGRMELWRTQVSAPDVPGASEQLTYTGGNRRPAVSTDRTKLAWVGAAGTVVIRDRTRRIERNAAKPVRVTSAPAWSPDGSCMAVASDQFGRNDIYLVRSDGSRALRLTTLAGDEDAPEWRPARAGPPDAGLAFVIDVDGARVVTAVDGLVPYLARLEHPPDLRVFVRPRPQ